MSEYELIGIDHSEASLVRRHLHRWEKTDEEAILPLILAIKEEQALLDIHIAEPRWETNVYPLYYWAEVAVGSRKAYEYVLDLLPDLFAHANTSLVGDELIPHLTRIMNSEIDILVEDFEYFMFIEAKIPEADRKTKFQTIEGVHQLVRQYIQGKILEQIISKKFALATIGANNAKPIGISLNTTEQALVSMVNEDRKKLEISDLPWSLLVRPG